MNKIFKKLKSNKLLIKACALIGVVMILCSSLVIPASASSTDGITDLTYTNWEIDSIPEGFGSFDVAGAYGDESTYYSFDSIALGYMIGNIVTGELKPSSDYLILFTGDHPIACYSCSSDSPVQLFFGSGADINNVALITWLVNDCKPIYVYTTEPVTDVFSGVLSWVVSALGSVSGAFISDGIEEVIELEISNTPTTIPLMEEETMTGYLVSNFPYDQSAFIEPQSHITFSYGNAGGDSFTGTFEAGFGLFPELYVGDVTFTDYNGEWYCSVPGRVLYNPTITVGDGSLSLTFLGTLAVIGVGFGFILLLIYFIVNFFKSRR